MKLKILLALSIAVTIPAHAATIKKMIQYHRLAFGGTCAGLILAFATYDQKLKLISKQLKAKKSQLKAEDVSFFTPHAHALKKLLAERKKMSAINPGRIPNKSKITNLVQKIEEAIITRRTYAKALTGLSAIICAAGLYWTR